MQGISNLLALDPFQEIDPMESYVSFEEHQQYLSAIREHAKYFFTCNGLEEGEEKGTVDDSYYIELVEEGDQDEDGAFEIKDYLYLYEETHLSTYIFRQ